MLSNMNLQILLIFIEATLIQSHFNINKTSDIIKSYLDNYKYRRLPRCTNIHKMDNVISETMKLIGRNRDISDSLDISQCVENSTSEYIRNHIVNGLIVHEDLPVTHWHDYKSVHKKLYKTPKEELTAMIKWRNNLQRVAQHNRDFIMGKQSYSLHLNRFGDLDIKEYFNKFLKLLHPLPLFDPAEDFHRTTYTRKSHHKVPEKFDWRAKGFRPRHEEQHHCGACYAFTVAHALQAQLYKKHGIWGELSPQQIVDCSFKDGNLGCDGGSLKGALRYAARDGLVHESQYPYIGKKGHCKYQRYNYQVKVRARRWATLPAHDEAAIENALATIGPLAVALNAAPFTFQLYRSGIYDDLFCTPWQLNHAMLLVGYTLEYWVLLNWWGKNWGEDGYIRVRRGFNRCGITNMATYVEV